MNYYELPFKKYCFTIYYDLGQTTKRPCFIINNYEKKLKIGLLLDNLNLNVFK